MITGLGGQLNFTAGNETFTVEVDAGTTLAELAVLISEAEDNFGVNTSLIDTGLGDIRLIIMSDKMGNGNDLFVTSKDTTIEERMGLGVDEVLDPSTIPDHLIDEMNLTSNTLGLMTDNLMSTRIAQDAVIVVEGTEVRSENNNFNNVIRGLKIESA